MFGKKYYRENTKKGISEHLGFRNFLVEHGGKLATVQACFTRQVSFEYSLGPGQTMNLT